MGSFSRLRLVQDDEVGSGGGPCVRPYNVSGCLLFIMFNFTVEKIAEITGGKLFSKNEKEKITAGFGIDSRTVKSGQFFIAIRGKNYDGHNFIGEALRGNAAGLIVQCADEALFKKNVCHIIVVKDTIKAMAAIASAMRREANIPVICITGTNGKTTVKNMLTDILSVKYKVLKSPASYNNIIGVSLTLFRLTENFDIAIIELGTSFPGEISRLAAIAAPETVIITNIGHGHLSGLSDRRGVFAEKIKLLKFLPFKGKAFLNKDDDLLRRVRSKNVSLHFFGMDKKSDSIMEGIRKKKEGYEFFLGGEKYYLPFAGLHNVSNAAAAISAARNLGIGYARTREALKRTNLPKMRLEKTVLAGCKFINDAYNANPDSFECALQFLQSEGSGKKGVVAGEMAELGPRSRYFHRKIGESIAKKNIDFLIVVGTRAGHMARAAEEHGMRKENIIYAASHARAAEILKKISNEDTTVLIKGSRAAKMEEVIKCYTMLYTH